MRQAKVVLQALNCTWRFTAYRQCGAHRNSASDSTKQERSISGVSLDRDQLNDASPRTTVEGGRAVISRRLTRDTCASRMTRHLHAGRARADAGVGVVTGRQVLGDALTADVEASRVGPPAFVAVGGAEQDHGARTGRGPDAADLGVLVTKPVKLDRCLQAQDLVDCTWEERSIGAQQVPLVGGCRAAGSRLLSRSAFVVVPYLPARVARGRSGRRPRQAESRLAR